LAQTGCNGAKTRKKPKRKGRKAHRKGEILSQGNKPSIKLRVDGNPYAQPSAKIKLVSKIPKGMWVPSFTAEKYSPGCGLYGVAVG